MSSMGIQIPGGQSQVARGWKTSVWLYIPTSLHCPYTPQQPVPSIIHRWDKRNPCACDIYTSQYREKILDTIPPGRSFITLDFPRF